MLVSTLILVSIASFALVEIAEGEAVDTILPPGATEEERAAVEAAYGLSGPVVTRYFDLRMTSPFGPAVLF